MDKNTITGMVLIFLVLIVFSYLSRPSQEQLAAQQQYYDSIAQVQQRAAELQAKAEAALANERATASKDSASLFFGATQGTSELVSIENNLAKLTLNTKGGSLYSVTLKEYMSQDKVTPVTLFEDRDVSLNYLLYNAQGAIETSEYYFTPINKSEQAVTMRLKASEESYVDFTYTMHPDTYLVDLNIQAVGMNGKLASSNNHIDIEWRQRARQIEKGYTYENRLAQLTYKTADDVEEIKSRIARNRGFIHNVKAYIKAVVENYRLEKSIPAPQARESQLAAYDLEAYETESVFDYLSEDDLAEIKAEVECLKR